MRFLRDHTRDDLCAALQALGIQAQMSERGRPEEKITRFGISVGIIDIPDELIRWVEVKNGTLSGGDVDTYNHINCGVPDSRITAGFHKVEIRIERIKRIPLVGKVVDLKWAGKDFGLGLIERLSHDVSLNKPILESLSEGLFEIGAYPDHGCWILTVQDELTPSRQEWDCYQSIASHLLGTPLPSGT